MLLSYRRWRRNEPSPLISPPTKAKSVASRNSRVVAHHPLPSASSYSAKSIANNFKLLNVIELPEVAAK
ncbi:hypothetical protein F2Q70_00028272 [Brassica cretica]|uniref:Uncharacterized protein n=1 Tax=Brassica cretica TaxID=69181 RepID=A0A8S9L9G9_BRACR|nr:hypothetical protein F2Q70_00028272 [Brassica cretica]